MRFLRRTPDRLRQLLSLLSPRARRWRRHLRSLTLDPDRLPRPIGEPSGQDVIICGVPRSGTTLAAAILFQPPRVVTVMEPWDGLRLPPQVLFESIRREIAETGTCRRGKLDHRALLERGEVSWTSEGASAPRLDVNPDFLLAVKWPAFWRYVPLLPGARFIVCVRDPCEVLRSFVQQGGRLARGLEYDVPFHARMNRELLQATDDDAVRRALMYEHVTRALLPYLDRPNVYTLRYERWFTEPTQLIDELSAFLSVSLEQGPAKISGRAGSSNPPGLRELVRRWSPSARALGYKDIDA